MHLVTNNGVLAVKILIYLYTNNFTRYSPTETESILPICLVSLSWRQLRDRSTALANMVNDRKK